MRNGSVRWLALLGALLTLFGGLVACSSESEAPPPTPSPTATATAVPATPGPNGNVPVASPGPAPGSRTLTLKVVSFNVLWGAGVDRRFDENIPARLQGQDRMPQVMAFLREAAPDILVVEEAAGWDAGEPSVAEIVARELGMSYVIAPDAWELHIVLFSRFPIIEASYVSRLQDFNGVALRAKVAVTPDAALNVIGVHLNSMSSQTRTCQVEAILDMAAGLEGRTLLLGDMNSRPTSPQAEALMGAGWQLVAAQERWPIDQIWIDGSGEARQTSWWAGIQEPEGVSDHWPVGVEMSFVSPRTQTIEAEPVREPQPMAYSCPLPPR